MNRPFLIAFLLAIFIGFVSLFEFFGSRFYPNFGSDVLLVQQEANMFSPGVDAGDIEQALVLAVKESDYREVQKLLGQGADPNIRIDHYPILITDFVLYGGDTKMAKLLLDAGANPEASDLAGYIRALDVAVLTGDVENVRLLLVAGAGVNGRNAMGETALHTAAAHGSIQIISELIQAGARLDVRSNAGYTPLNIALRLNNYNAAAVLLRAGSDCNNLNLIGPEEQATVAEGDSIRSACDRLLNEL